VGKNRAKHAKIVKISCRAPQKWRRFFKTRPFSPKTGHLPRKSGQLSIKTHQLLDKNSQKFAVFCKTSIFAAPA